MNYTIQNEQLTVKVASLGGELMSIKSRAGAEYLWQGDEAYWTGHAPNLFPFVGRLTEGRYIYHGTSYPLGTHGFVRNSELSCTGNAPDKLSFMLKENDETLKKYPFAFEYRINYALHGNRLEVEYNVTDTHEKIIYFGIGAHPGFRVPLEDGLAFEDYFLEFESAGTPNLEILTDTCFVTGEKAPYPLKDGRVLPLKHSLFDKDALVFSDICRSVTLKTGKGSRFVRVDYPDMPHLGIWHRPKTDAPYVCIEPWASLPGYDGEITDLENRKGLISLQPGKCYSNRWSITVG